MKVYLAAAVSFVAGYAVCKFIYTEKVLQSYQMGWEDSKEDSDDLNQKDQSGKKDASVKGTDVVEEVEEVTAEAAEALVKHVGYDQISKKDKPAKQPKGPTVSTVVDEKKTPKIISQEEFFDRGLATQYQITYYAGDDVLVGRSGDPITAEARITGVGVDTLSQFGVDSGDENVVYVRNFEMDRGKGVDFEITRDWGKYSDNLPDEPA